MLDENYKQTVRQVTVSKFEEIQRIAEERSKCPCGNPANHICVVANNCCQSPLNVVVYKDGEIILVCPSCNKAFMRIPIVGVQ